MLLSDRLEAIIESVAVSSLFSAEKIFSLARSPSLESRDFYRVCLKFIISNTLTCEVYEIFRVAFVWAISVWMLTVVLFQSAVAIFNTDIDTGPWARV